MSEPNSLYFFILASVILLLTPGPAVAYIIARSIHQGRIAGIVSVLGLELGTLCHVIGAALGLSTLLLSSALAFNVVKYLGAAYLIYLGLEKLGSKAALEDQFRSRELAKPALKSVFWQGVLVNILNPKTALFFFAFLPQFVNVSQGNIALQMFLLGSLFVGLAIVSDGLYALLAGSLGHWIRSNRQFLKGERYLVGGIYIGLGLTTALSGSKS